VIDLIDSIKKILKENLEEIYLIGLWDKDDEEFIINNNYVYLKFLNKFVEIEAIDSYGRLKLKICDEIEKKCDVDDMKEGKIKISNIVLLNPLFDYNKIKNISFCNIEVTNSYILTDILQIELLNEQLLFLDPEFLGINIGGIEQKEFWKENNYKSSCVITKIKI
jgi:hypothetical protein